MELTPCRPTTTAHLAGPIATSDRLFDMQRAEGHIAPTTYVAGEHLGAPMYGGYWEALDAAAQLASPAADVVIVQSPGGFEVRWLDTVVDGVQTHAILDAWRGELMLHPDLRLASVVAKSGLVASR